MVAFLPILILLLIDPSAGGLCKDRTDSELSLDLLWVVDVTESNVSDSAPPKS
jgi:hypothetical protein